jgi:hypothetical protein
MIEVFLFLWYIFVFSVCFETDVFISVVSKWVRNKPKKIVIGFAKQTENEPEQIEFRFVSVRTEKKFVCFEDTQLVAIPYFLLTSKSTVNLQLSYKNEIVF